MPPFKRASPGSDTFGIELRAGEREPDVVIHRVEPSRRQALSDDPVLWAPTELPRVPPLPKIPTQAGSEQAAVRRVALSSGSQMLGTLVSGLITIFLIRILTAHLGANTYGQYVVLISFSTGAAILVDLGLNGVTYRDIARDPESAGRIIGTNLGLRVFLSLGVMPVVVGLVFVLYPHERSAILVPAAILAGDILLTVIQTTAGSYFGAKVRSEVNAALLLGGRVMFFGGVLISSVEHWGLRAVVISYVGADFVTAVISLVLLHRAAHLELSLRPAAWWSTFKRAAPLGLMQLLNTLYLYLDSILLSLLSTNRQVAFYGLGFGVIAVVGSFSNMFASALVPGLAVQTLDGARAIVERALYVTLSVCVPLGVGGAVLAGNIVGLLGRDSFSSARPAFVLLSLSLLFTFPGTVLSYAAVSIDRYRRLVAVTAVALALNIGLNVVLIPRYGATGAATALLASEGVSTVFVYVVFSRYLGHFPSLRKVWRPVIAGGVMAVFGVWLTRRIGEQTLLATIVEAAAVVEVYCVVLYLSRGIPEEANLLLGQPRPQ